MKHIILLIDDDEDDRFLFCEAMEEVAPTTISCYGISDCRTALAQLAKREIKLPDLIFLDVNMPVMNGWQCLAILKQEEAYRHIPVIMYSTSSYREDADKARRAGALCFLTKPSDFKELKKCMEMVAGHLADNTLDQLAVSSITAWSVTC